jgi:6-phosphogluconolactonase (cycloisomerase 2 family)
MKRVSSFSFVRPILMAGLFLVSHFGVAATNYVISNDDAPFPFRTGVSFYAIGSNGLLAAPQQVLSGGNGIAGGFFGANRLAALNSGGQQCVYASAAASGNIVGIDAKTLTLGGTATGSPLDAGTSNGIGLAVNAKYLYASFTDSGTIGTFQVQAGCSLTFVADIAVSGIGTGIINGMAIHGNMLIATYTDGSIESFDISRGTPASHGDKQFSTASFTSMDANYPNSIDVTKDGHFAIFGDTSTSVVVEVSDISSGKLAKTTVYKSSSRISSSNVRLSPDESLLYVVNTQGDSVSAILFDKKTGTLSGGCTSNRLKGQSANWSYLGGLAFVSQAGNGGGVYVAEFGGSSAIALVNLTTSGQQCTLQEAPQSPFADPNAGLLSIGNFPPRSF